MLKKKTLKYAIREYINNVITRRELSWEFPLDSVKNSWEWRIEWKIDVRSNEKRIPTVRMIEKIHA